MSGEGKILTCVIMGKKARLRLWTLQPFRYGVAGCQCPQEDKKHPDRQLPSYHRGWPAFVRGSPQRDEEGGSDIPGLAGEAICNLTLPTSPAAHSSQKSFSPEERSRLSPALRRRVRVFRRRPSLRTESDHHCRYACAVARPGASSLLKALSIAAQELPTWSILSRRSEVRSLSPRCFGAPLDTFPSGSDGKESACNVGDPGSIPGSRRFPGEENSNPLQHSCLENSTASYSLWVAKSWTRLK
ncbi:uncharacterized protein LOC122426022 isoform X2 [Cervus canadensis]|uniref:uncharacterized protein LOC122426022 isoform X2 n=1 Tax=Cervus canadensis TaxID=1574408 RepID=UPI001CA32E98|nr:uncharacterized protein LOC122426022 isoform X2 [Cervus canadensis]